MYIYLIVQSFYCTSSMLRIRRVSHCSSCINELMNANMDVASDMDMDLNDVLGSSRQIGALDKEFAESLKCNEVRTMKDTFYHIYSHCKICIHLLLSQSFANRILKRWAWHPKLK